MTLLHFDRPFNFTNKVKPAKLPEKILDNKKIFIAVGVGAKPEDDTVIPGYPPRKINVTGLSDEDCDVECNKQPMCVDETEGMGSFADDFVCGKGRDNEYVPGLFVKTLSSYQVIYDTCVMCTNNVPHCLFSVWRRLRRFVYN